MDAIHKKENQINGEDLADNGCKPQRPRILTFCKRSSTSLLSKFKMDYDLTCHLQTKFNKSTLHGHIHSCTNILKPLTSYAQTQAQEADYPCVCTYK